MNLRIKRNKNMVFNAMCKHFDRIALKNDNHITLFDIWNVEDFIQKKFKLNDRQIRIITYKVFNNDLLKYNSK